MRAGAFTSTYYHLCLNSNFINFPLLKTYFRLGSTVHLLYIIFFVGKNGSGASETKHWQDMITKPRQTIVQWHRLKPE